MQCPYCQTEIKDQAKFCKHCGKSISEGMSEEHTEELVLEQSEQRDMMETTNELAQSESGSEASSFVIDTSPEVEEKVDLETTEETTRKSNISIKLALLAAVSSTMLVWLISGLLSFVTNRSLLSSMWNYVSTQLAIPIEKSILLEQKLSSSIWFIVNSFIGGQFKGQYSVKDELFSSFQLSFPIIFALVAMIAIVFLHIKIIDFINRRRGLSISVAHKAMTTLVYFLATWLFLIVTLYIFAPRLQLPFIEAPEQLKLGVSIVSSLLYSISLFITGAALVWLPWKRWYKTRRFVIVTFLFSALLALSQLYVQLWQKRSFDFQQLTGLHHNGLDLLWLNRFVAELLMSFGGRYSESTTSMMALLQLPSSFSWQYGPIFVIGICLITLLFAVKASWPELISIGVISSWFLYIANQFTRLSVVTEMSFMGLTSNQADLYQLSWITGLLIPISIVLAILAVTKLVSPLLKIKVVNSEKSWLKHIAQNKQLYAGLLILLFISSITVFNIVGDTNKEPSSLSKQAKYEQQWAKQVLLMQQAPADYALKAAHQLWSEQGTAESKALLAIAYLHAYQPIKAHSLLNESLLESNKLFSKQQLTELFDASNLDDPLSVIHTGAQVASIGEEEVDYLLDTAMDSYVAPIVTETLQEVEKNVLPKLVNDELAELQQQLQLDPEYIDFMKASEPDLVSALQQVYETATAELDEEIRIQYEVEQTVLREQDSSTNEHGVYDNEEVKKQWYDYVDDAKANKLLTLAKAAIYYGDTAHAEKWLSLLHLYGEKSEEVDVLLASIFLNIEYPSSDVTQLPEYEHAVNEAAQLLKEKFEFVLKDYELTTNEQLQETIGSAHVDQDLQAHLGYVLLLPYEESASTEVLYQLSKYHYQAGQLEEANKKIEELQKKVDELELKQQYIIQKLNELPEQTGDMTIEQMEQKHELTAELYVHLEPLEGKNFYEQPLTGEQQAFSVYLSNQLLSFNKSSAHITSIQYDDGMVTLFAQSDNTEITKNGLELFDNGQKITDFELTKLTESSSFERFVMLILDQSGSMEGQKIEVATQSAAQFVYALEHDEAVGLIPFSSSNSLAVPFTKNYVLMEQALASLSANGGTDIAPALTHGMNQLEDASGERIAFIISDGEDEEFSNPAVRQSIIQNANAAGITIYAVGFDAGYQTLRDVAEGTGGQYIGATDFESLSKSFDTIRETLSRTYQIKYKVDSNAYGQHRVDLEHEEYNDTKTYTINDPNGNSFAQADNDEDGFTIEQPEPKADKFAVTSYSPRKIVVSKTGSTTVTIEGTKLNEVETVSFDGKAIDFKQVNKEKLTISLSNKQTIGTHKVTLTTKDKKQEELTIAYANSAAQESVKFGYAILYGDFIETKGNQITLVGDISIDKFIYPTGDKMTLVNEEELTFKGMALKVDNTILRQFKHGYTMTASNFGKTFSISSDSAYSEAVSSLPGLDRFGIELKLAPVFTYNADMKTDDGTLNVRGGMTNFYKLYMLNGNIEKIKIKNTPIKWLPSDASAAVDYSKSGYTISGTASVSLMLQGMGFDGVTLSFTYPHADKRLILKGQVTGMKLFKMQTSRANSTRITLEVGVHHSNGLDRIGGELASNVSVPLGPSGLGLYKFGFLADWSAKNAGSVTLGIDTIADKAFDKFVGAIAKIPVVNKIFDFDDGICLICVDGTVGFTEIASTNWTLNGKLTAEMVGFKMAEVTTKVNKNELELQKMKNKLIYNLDTKANIVFADSNFRDYTTLKYQAAIDAIGFNPHTFILVYVPEHFDYSYAELSKEKKGKTIVIQRIGSNLNIIK